MDPYDLEIIISIKIVLTPDRGEGGINCSNPGYKMGSVENDPSPNFPGQIELEAVFFGNNKSL